MGPIHGKTKRKKIKEGVMLSKTLKNSKGFTLIELMIVIAIIGILAAIAIPQFSKYRERAAKATAISDAKNLANELESYYADNQSYPPSLASISFNFSKNNTAIGYQVIGNTAFRFSISNTRYGKYVVYDSSSGGLNASTWQ